MENKETLIINILREAYPELDCSPGTPFYELAVRPMSYLWTRHEEGNAELTSGAYLENYATMSEEDLDRLMSHFFATRKTGDYVYAVARIVFTELRDYYIPKGMPISKGTNTYTTVTDTYISSAELNGNATEGYPVDVSIVSDGVSNIYNLSMNDSLNTTSSLSTYIRKIYVVADSSDGGITETNTDFYNRVSRSMSLSNLTTYRGTKATLYEKFNVTEVLPIGIRDAEMRRDLVELDPLGLVHRGGMADIYVKAEPYTVVTGYRGPLGFPYTYKGVSLTDNPDLLMSQWNAIPFTGVNIFNRGSALESSDSAISNKVSVATDMESLTSDIQSVHDYCSGTAHEALHSDNLVKQMWPLLVRVNVNVASASDVLADGRTHKQAAKDAIVNYIMGLKTGGAPKVANLIQQVIAEGVTTVTLPVELTCYYLTENMQIQYFGLNGVRSTNTSILRPVENDSLKFVIDDDTQISIRNCTWYTNEDLVMVNGEV